MTLRERKRLLFLLQELAQHDENQKELSPELVALFTDAEIRALILWLYPKMYHPEELKKIERSKLLKSISSNRLIMEWTINTLERNITNTLKFTQSEIVEFFSITQQEAHYLNFKPINEWDSYDFANYQNLLRKSGNGKLVYAIFTSDVKEEDKYIVTTKPSFFFDTEEEAETEMERYYNQEQNPRGSLKVMSLWQINF